MKKKFAITSLAFVLLTCVLLLASCSCKHTYSEWQTTREATCTEAGEKTRTCSKCNDVQTETVSALGHDLGALIPSKEPTCTEDGYTEHYHCARCGKDFAQSGTEIEAKIPASHKLEFVAEVVSCTTNGVAAHDHCTVCGKNFIGGVEKTDNELKTAPVNHTLEFIAEVDATCTSGGVLAHDRCSVCGKNFIAGVEETDDELKTDALGHNYYTVEALDATCTTDGAIAHLHCDGCGSNIVKGVEKTAGELKIPASHSLVTVSGAEKTCTTDGVIEHERCTVCGKCFIDGVEKTDSELKISAGHELEDVAEVAKTCTTDGVLAHEHCTVCDKNFIDGVEKTDDELKIETTGHIYGNLIQESGKKDHYQCSVCGKYFDADHNEITVLELPSDHTFGAWTAKVPETCTTNGMKGYYTCSDASCAGKYFDIDYNEIDDLTIPAAHKWSAEPEYNFSEHYFVCTVCSYVEEYVDHDLTTEYVKENGQWYEYQKCKACAYKTERSAFDKIADITPIRSFLVDRYDLYMFYMSVLYENDSTSEDSIISYIDTDAFYDMVQELKKAGVFPVTKTVTLSMRNFTKDVEITFDLHSEEAVPEYTVYQKGYLTDLGDIRFKFVSNSGYTSGYTSLSYMTVTDDGGFNPDYDFADGDKVYTISFTYDEEEYALSFTYVNRKVVRKISTYDDKVNLGEYPEIRIEYTDDTTRYTDALSAFDMTDGAFDKDTVGKYTFTLKSKDGFATETFTVEVVDPRSISGVDGNVYMALGEGTFKVKVQYNDGTEEYLTLTPYAIINPDCYNSGNPFDNTTVGSYEVTARIKGFDTYLCINVYDPENLSAIYIYVTFDTPILCEVDAEGNVILDATYLYICAKLNDGTEEYVQLGPDMWTASMGEDGKSGTITVTYKGAITSFEFKIAEKDVSVFSVCTKESGNVREILAKDKVLDGYFLKVSAYDGGYYYVPLTSDMFYLGSEKFDMSSSENGWYDVRVEYGGKLTSDRISLIIYSDSDVLQSFSGGDDTAICGSYEYVMSQIEKMYFYYYEYVHFSAYLPIYSERVDFNDVTVGDVSEYDFTKPGEVKIPLTYKDATYTLELMLIPDLSLYESEEYTMECWGEIFAAQVYDMGYIVYRGSTYTFEIFDEANGIYNIDDDLYFINEDEKAFVRFRGSMLGVEPTVYFFQGYKVEIYTKNGVSYADIYEPYDEDYDYNSTSECVLGDGTVELQGMILSVVPGTNELTVYIEGETVYTYVEDHSSWKFVYQFNDNGKIYLFNVTTDPDTSEETKEFLTYAEWKQTDNVVSIIVDGRPEMIFSVDDKGNLTPIG
ncbi:MAG: hypothetical protein SPH68_05580 [Candidatus Borkfalkiaceae bacterium]|nr:hypothetical protein [Clostridia bacterium]MDY6223610.1 hypothetical protein [Christensenellaceae bacterium]